MRFAPQTIPAPGAGLFCTAGSRASSGLEPCGVLTSTPQVQSRSAAGWLPGGTDISAISRRRPVHNAGWWCKEMPPLASMYAEGKV
jgi:hypothetical protein